DRADQVDSHAREIEQPLAVAAEQFADDVLNVAAAAEGLARAGDDDDAAGFALVQMFEERAEFCVHLKGQRVVALRAVQRDGPHAVGFFVQERLWLHYFPSSRAASLSRSARRFCTVLSF